MSMLVLFLLLVVLPTVYAAADEYKPYLHKATVPEHPKVKLYGSYRTNLFPGAATYSYPIEVPRGTNGLQPAVALSYNSQSVKGRPGVVGGGWSLTQNYVYRDTNATLSNAGNDEFKLLLNGNMYDLVYVAADGFWHTEIESFLRVQNFTGGNGTYGMYWLVTARDGTQFRFGMNNDSEMTSNTGYSYAVKWSLDQVEDVFWNKVFYSYVEDPNAEDKGTAYLSQILYNNDKQRNISFVYETSVRSDRRVVYETGQKVDESRRLANITVSAGGALVRKYGFDYVYLNNEKSVSSLSKVTFVGADGNSVLHNATFEYYAEDAPEYQQYQSSTWEPPVYFDNWQHEDHAVRLADINNDGFVDIVRTLEGSGLRKAWLNNKQNGWNDESATWAPPSPLWIIDTQKRDNGFRFVDFSSDGFVDILLQSNNDPGPPEYRYAYRNDGDGTWTDVSSTWNVPSTMNIIEHNKSEGVEFADIDGDGRTDIIQSFDNSAEGSGKKAYRNNGSGWTDVSSSWVAPVYFITDGSDNGVRLVDLNGDGLADLVRGKSGTREAWLNNGAGWAENSSWAPPIDFVTSTNPDNGVRIADVNSDGLPDLLQDLANATSNEDGAWLNNGSGWVRNDTWKAPTAFTSGGHNMGRRVADPNGDGIPDILLSYDNSPSPGSNKTAWIRNMTTPFLLRRITNEFGGVVELQYNTSTRFNNTGGNDSFSDLGFNVWVVDRVKQNNTMSGAFNVFGLTNYNYSSGMYDYADFEFRGFKQVFEFLPDNTTVQHFFYQNKSLKGKEYRTEVYDVNKNIFSIANNTFNSTLTNGYYRNFLSTEQSSLYDGNSTNPKTTRTSYTYDNYGNLLEKTSHGDTALAGDERTERYSFALNTTAWIVDRVSTYQLNGNNSNKIRETRYFYDNVTIGSAPLKGALTKIESWLNGSKINPTTSFTYDSFGNIKTKTDALGHTTTYFYDNTSTYATKIVNALDQPTTYEYDFGTGNLLFEERNNIRKRYTYDTFGRPSKEILPYDSDAMPTKSFNYSFDGSAPESIKITLREHSNVTSDIYYFYDGLGNLIQLKSPAESNQQIIKNIYYDILGRIPEEDNPYFDTFSTSLATPSAIVNKTRYTYDALARVTKVTNPDLTNKTITFDHWTISDYDENGHRHDYVLDGFGQIVKVVENNNDPILGGTEQYNTTYAYSVAGELVGIRDTLGNTFNFTYDTLGRKTAMDDPDLGHWEYTYDIAGNLIKQNDSRKNVTTLIYDDLNRVVNKNSSSLNISFGYDQQFFGTLSNITGNYTFKYTYDDRFRVIKEEALLRGTSFETGATYDSMDRLIEKRVPENDLDYYYNRQGRLEKIPGYISSATFSAFGSPSSRVYNNSLTTTFAYQNNNNRLNSIRTGAVQELNYTYDNVGNVLSIIDNTHSLTYRMGYDYLDRLVNTTIENDVYRYGYNPIGNLLHMTKKNETLRYTYGSLAHAPDQIITSKTSVHVYNLRNVTSSSRNITFDFSLVNELNTSLTDVNWTVDLDDGNRRNGTVASLAVNGVANITLQHNYTRGGDYTVNVSAVAAGATDQQKLALKFGTRAHDLRNVHLNITQAVYQFDIKNDVLENISNINWTCAEISSTQEIKLSGSEIVNVLLDYNYSTAGKKSFTCKADSPQGNESKTISLEIPALVIENYNMTTLGANARQVQFTVKNYWSSLNSVWTITSDGQKFTNSTTLATGASLLVEQNITYTTDSAKTIEVNVSSGSTIYESVTDSFTLYALGVEDYQRINKTPITNIFAFNVKNYWPQNLTTWWNLTDPSVVNSSVLAQNQSVMVFVEHQYSTQGQKTPVINAYSGSFKDYLKDIFKVKHVSIEEQQTLHEANSRAVTELRTKSNNGIQNITWRFNASNEIITATNSTELNATKDVWIFIESNYSTSGVYPTKAEINSSSYSDNSTGVAIT